MNLKVHIEDINIDDSHRYSYKENTNIPSVTTIIGGSSEYESNTMRIGSIMHQAINSWITRKPNFQELGSYLDTNNQLKLKKLLRYIRFYHYIKKLKFANSLSEQKFVAEVDKSMFGGTVDMVVDDTVFEFKTGNQEKVINKQIIQLSVYCKCLGIEKGLLLYFDKENKLCKQSINQEEIQCNYLYFLTILRTKYGLYNDLDIELKDKSQVYTDIKNTIDRLTEIKYALRDEIGNIVKMQNTNNKYKVDNFTIYEVKDRVNYTLKKEYKQALLDSKPNFFDSKKKNGYFIITQSKKQKGE